MMNFNCTQHQCFDCLQKTSDAGGMIYRCRWCERGYCEDCLDWDKTDLLGENLKEYELLGFPSVTQAFYIRCPNCTDHHLENPEALKFCDNRAAEIDTQFQSLLDKQALVAAAAEVAKKPVMPISRAESLTDATTLDDSGVCTPQFSSNDVMLSSSSRKRKAAPETFKATPSKRSSRVTA
jgi:SWI/SNF-related matrix-associated actin-dependent regulator of chromatin subfamily A member 5